MSIQRRLLPSVSALSAFEGVARTRSFSQTATELGLTQGAISRQVQALEEHIGSRLIVRTSQGCTLTPAGQAYAEAVRQALAKIANATLAAQSDRRAHTVSLAIGPAIGTQWLMPKMNDFLQKNRSIHFNFVTRYTQPVDFSGEDLDAATYCGDKYDDSLNFDLLFHDNMLPVCTPSFLNAHRIREPRDFLSLPLLHEAARLNAWPDWFAANDVDVDQVDGQALEHFYVVAHAALAGLGVAMLPIFAIEPELRRGDLVVAIDRPVVLGKTHYLVSPKDRSDKRPFRTFRSWLLAQCTPTPPVKGATKSGPSESRRSA